MSASVLKLRTLLERLPVATGLVDDTGLIYFRNQRYIDLFGYDEADVPTISEWWLKAYPEEEYRRSIMETWEAAVRHAAERGADIEGRQYQVTCRDGRKKDIEISGIIIGDDMLATFIDNTARNQAEAELRKLWRAVEQSAATVVITDTEGNIEYVNPAFSRVTGYSQEEAIGRNPRILQSGAQPPEFYKSMWETLLSGSVWRGEISNKKKNGGHYWESAAIAPVKDARESQRTMWPSRKILR